MRPTYSTFISEGKENNTQRPLTRVCTDPSVNIACVQYNHLGWEGKEDDLHAFLAVGVWPVLGLCNMDIFACDSGYNFIGSVFS